MRWIVVDGIDGAGKSTHARWIREHYEARGESVRVFVHPSSRWVGRMTRRALQGKGGAMRAVASVLFILDVLFSLSALKRYSSDCDTLIFVRYIMATAYLPGRLSRLGYDFFFRLLPVPSRLLLVDIQPETALRRIAHRDHQREMFENLPSLIQARDKTLELAGEDWRIVDNNDDEETSRKRLEAILDGWDRSG